jgi:hypothetical protein
VYHQELLIAAHAVSGHLSNYKHSICLQIMCGYAIMYNLFFILIKICFYGTFYIKPYKSIVFLFVFTLLLVIVYFLLVMLV